MFYISTIHNAWRVRTIGERMATPYQMLYIEMLGQRLHEQQDTCAACPGSQVPQPHNGIQDIQPTLGKGNGLFCGSATARAPYHSPPPRSTEVERLTLKARMLAENTLYRPGLVYKKEPYCAFLSNCKSWLSVPLKNKSLA